MVFDSFPTNEHFSLKWNNLLIVRQNHISASALFCVYVASYFFSCARCEWAIPLFSSPSRNQVNTPQSKKVIFPFKYGKCKHKNIYTSVKLLSQREYTITKRKSSCPSASKGLLYQINHFDSSHGKSSVATVLFHPERRLLKSTVSPTRSYTYNSLIILIHKPICFKKKKFNLVWF